MGESNDMNSILEFIKSFECARGAFVSKLSYWFVQILIDRFKGDYWIDILYIPKENRFVARMYEVGKEFSEGHYFNADGCVDCMYKSFDGTNDLLELVDIFDEQPELYYKLMREHRDFKEANEE